MTDYNFLLEIRLSPPQFQTLNHVSRIAAGLGFNLYLAGGAVRDVTLGQSSIRNLNFVTEGNVQRIFRALEHEAGRKHARGPAGASSPSGIVEIESARFDATRHSAVLSFVSGVIVDIIATQRIVYSKPGHPPQIHPAGIFEDLRNRGFSANAMAISLHPNSRGLLLDPTNGAADIEAREFRALSNRTFVDDPSRIYRLIRLSLRLGFKIEERTQSWLESALQAKAWEWMTPQQQARELRDLLQEENPWRVLRAFADRGLMSGLDRGLAKVHPDRLEKLGGALRSAAGNETFLLHLDTLSAKLPPAQKKHLAQKVILDSKTLKLAVNMEGEARKLARLLGSARTATPSANYRLLATKPRPLLLYMLSHYPQARVQKQLKDFLFKYPQIREKLPYTELQALGVESGPRSESILNALFMAMLDGKIKSQAQMSKALRELAGIRDSDRGRADTGEIRQDKNEKVASRSAKRRKGRSSA